MELPNTLLVPFESHYIFADYVVEQAALKTLNSQDNRYKIDHNHMRKNIFEFSN